MPAGTDAPFFFFFNDTATTEIYTLSLHDALPICSSSACSKASTTACGIPRSARPSTPRSTSSRSRVPAATRSEEHTSELQSQSNLVCRLLLEKKKKNASKNRKLDTSVTSRA